jgi:ribosome-binding factor A
MSRRTRRVEELMREELSDLLLRSVKDPRLEEGFLSITEVEVSPDLRHATVFVSYFGETPPEEVLAGLDHSANYLHNELMKRLSMRNVPHLAFRLDPSIERGARLAALIHEVKAPDER